LLSIGFFGAHDNRHGEPVTKREIILEVPSDGRRVERTVVLQAPPDLGLPSTSDRDKFLAFTKIAMESRPPSGLIVNPIRFSGYRMARELGASLGGQIYRDIYAWGLRMAGTIITSHHVVYNKRTKRYLDSTEHIFRKFRRAGDESGSNRAEVFEVELEEWLLENLNEMYVIREDWNAYKTLTRSTAKGLFGFLYMWFQASKGAPVDRSYTNICNRLNVPEYKYPAKIKDTMGRAFDELASIDYLSSWSLSRMVSTPGFKFTLVPGKEMLRVLEITGGLRNRPELSAAPGNLVVGKLISLGISKTKAIELSKTSSEEEMLDKIDFVESLIAEKGDTLTNPPGYAIKLLENGTEVPDSFKRNRRKEVIITARRVEREKQQDALLTELAYERWCQEQVDSMISARYPTPEALEAYLKSRLPESLVQFPSLKRFPYQAQIKQIRDLLHTEVRNELDLPTLEQWSEMGEYKNFVPSLFQLHSAG